MGAVLKSSCLWQLKELKKIIIIHGRNYLIFKIHYYVLSKCSNMMYIRNSSTISFQAEDQMTLLTFLGNNPD